MGGVGEPGENDLLEKRVPASFPGCDYSIADGEFLCGLLRKKSASVLLGPTQVGPRKGGGRG